MALWVDWVLDEDAQIVISTGPTAEVQIGQQVDWDLHSRQGVYLFPDTIPHVPNLKFTAVFYPTSGNITFDFKPDDYIKDMQPV